MLGVMDEEEAMLRERERATGYKEEKDENGHIIWDLLG